MKHRHCEVIKAWADGAKVQFRNPGWPFWENCSTNPTWDVLNEYRVKPETVRYRICLVRYSCGRVDTVSTTTEDFQKELELDYGFIRWLGDWQEVEV